MSEPNFSTVMLRDGHWQHPSANIARSAEIGVGCYIGPNVTIAPNVVIGPNTVIGDRGFGYQPDGTYRPHPHGVLIGPGVRIGANTCIDAGRWRTTIVQKDARIDNGCHIAHNVIVGKRTIVVAHSMIGGSCDIGEDVWISSAKLTDHVTVGDQAHIGLGAVVMRDVAAGAVVVGVPAREIRRRQVRRPA